MKNDILSEQVNAMAEAAGRTIDDEILFNLEYQRYIDGLPKWVTKLSNKRYDELVRSVHMIVHAPKQSN